MNDKSESSVTKGRKLNWQLSIIDSLTAVVITKPNSKTPLMTLKALKQMGSFFVEQHDEI